MDEKEREDGKMTAEKIDKKELCEYCGEQKATEKIANPNLDMSEDIDWNDKKSWWMVCKDCSKIIIFRKFGSPAFMIDDDLRRIMKKEFVAITDVEMIKNAKE